MKPMKGRAYHCLDRSNRDHTRGSALIALIAAILLFSVLAAALVPMVSSSGEQAVLSNLSDKAYMLAEAGYRLAKNHYDNPGLGITQNQALEALDDANFTLADGQGQFRLALYSYFYPIPTAANGTNTFTSNPPGRLPINSTEDDDNVTIQADPNRLLSIAGEIYTITATSGTPSDADDNVTFITLDRNLANISAGTSAYPAARATMTSLARGGDLGYNTGQGAMFPLRNGRINVQGYPNPLTYRYNNRTANRFEDVRDPGDTIANYSFSPSANIVLTKFARLNSTGIVGGGTIETQREVTYYLSGDSEEEEEVSVGLNDFERVEPSTTATALITPNGNEALAITRADNQTSLVQLNNTVGEAARNKGRRGSGGYLSYDSQVKVGFYSGLAPLPGDPVGIVPSAITPVAAGLTFRLSNVTSNTAFNGYGLSFVRANTTSPPADIFSNIVPSGLNDQPLMVLWQQTGNGTTWLAYKRLQTNIYPEPPNNFDAVLGEWTSSSYSRWRPLSSGGRPDSPRVWRYLSQEGAMLTSPPINLSCPAVPSTMCDEAPIVTLLFWAQEVRELSASEYRRALISYDSGPFLEFAPQRRNFEDPWYLYTYDLSPNVGRTIQIRLDVSASGTIEVPWYIDDVAILFQWPVQNSTLLVRLKEATVVRFANGGDQPILKGDRVYGQASGTQGVVIQPPLLESGNWAASSAAGTLLLNNVSMNTTGFQTGEDLWVVGRASGIGAEVASDPNASCAQNNGNCKVNIIKTFYASQAGSGTPNNDPMDPDTLPYPRRAAATDPLRWPPDEDDNWTADEDYFRLVQWDAVNDGNVTDLDSLSFRDTDGDLIQDAVIRSYHVDLQSPPLGQPAVTELGLHAYGAGADNVYYDDFGLRLLFSPGSLSLFDTVLQQ